MLTQKQANTLFEGTNFDIAVKYANILKALYFASFYAYAVPIGIVITIIYLVLTYWTDKYLLTQRAKQPPALGGSLSIEMTEMMELCLIFYAAGNIWCDALIFGEVDPFSWTVLTISVLNAILPMELINEWIFPVKDDNYAKETYDESRHSFEEEYDRTNPATKKKATMAYKMMLDRFTAEEKEELLNKKSKKEATLLVLD